MLQIRKITILKFSSLTKFHNILKLLFFSCVFFVAILPMLYKEGCKGNNKSQSYLNWMMNFYLCFHCADVLGSSFFLYLLVFAWEIDDFFSICTHLTVFHGKRRYTTNGYFILFFKNLLF